MKINFRLLAVWFAFIVLAGCGGRPASPTSGSTCDPKDRAIIEREWLTKDGQPIRHKGNPLEPASAWWHTCSSIEKIELLETTDKGKMYRVIWIGEIGGLSNLFPNTEMHTSKMYVKDGHIDSVQLQFLSAP